MRGDERGQVVQIAALLFLAIAILAFAGYQATVVPQETSAAELEHFEQTTTDLDKLQASIERTARDGQPDSTSVRMAPRYQSRFLAINPPRRSGTLENEQRSDGIVIENVVAEGETGDYWNGSEASFDTSRIVYRPSYDQFEDKPTRIYESSVRYDTFESGGTVVRRSQSLIRGDEIRLTAVQGDLQQSGPEARQVDTRPLSAPAETVTVSGDNDDPVVIEVPTELSEETWEELLESEIEDGNIESDEAVTVEDGVLTVELDGSTEYDLRLGAVGIGANAEDPDAEYIVDVRGDGFHVPAGTTVGMAAEVRDRYDNPFAGEDVDIEVVDDDFEIVGLGGGASVEPTSSTSRDDGTVPFRFNAPDTVVGEETYCVVADISDDSLEDELDPFLDQLPEILTDDCQSELGGFTDHPERALFQVTVFGFDDFDFPIWVNFEEPDTETPEDYYKDAGELYGDRGNNLTFGWDTPNAEYRERNSIDETRRDTLIHMDLHGIPTGLGWEIELDNGEYDVFLAMGDPDHTDSNHTVRIQDTVVVDEEGVGGSNFVNHSATVEVTDGTLRVEPIETGASGLPTQSSLGNQKVNFIHIEPAEPEEVFFEVSEFEAPETAQLLETIEVSATVENTGDTEGTQTVEYRFDGETEGEEEVTLSAGESTTVEFEHLVSNTPGEYEHGVFSEDDSDTASIDVDVIPISPISTFEITGVTDLVANQNDETQTFTFSFDGDLEEGDMVSIDLEDPQDARTVQGPSDEIRGISYPEGSASVETGSGTAEVDRQGQRNAELIYTAGSGGDSAGTEIEITVTGIEVGDVADEEYDVVFENDDAGSVTETFIVKSDDAGDTREVEDDTENVFSSGNVEIDDGVEISGWVFADGYVEGANDVTVGGKVSAGSDVEFGDRADIGGNVSSGGDMEFGNDGEIGGSLTASGDIELGDRTTVNGDIISGSDVEIGTDSFVDGDIDAQEVELGDRAEVTGDVHVPAGDALDCGNDVTINGQPCEEYVQENY